MSEKRVLLKTINNNTHNISDGRAIPSFRRLLSVITVIWSCGIMVVAADTRVDQTRIIMSCPFNQTFDATLQACCTVCPSGQGVALPCQPGNDTVCEPCHSGIEWSATASHSESCRKCYTCPLHAHETHACNATHNTRCRCNAGYYGRPISTDKFICKRCTQCAPGQYTLRPCDHRRDTACAACPAGTHSPVAGADACRACRVCPGGAAVKACTPEMDTICEGSPLMPSSNQNSPDRTTTGIESNQSQFTNLNLIPVYCTFLGAIIVGLVIYVILKRLNWLCFSPHNSMSKTGTGTDQHHRPETGTSEGPGTKSSNIMQSCLANSASTGFASMQNNPHPQFMALPTYDDSHNMQQRQQQVLHPESQRWSMSRSGTGGSPRKQQNCAAQTRMSTQESQQRLLPNSSSLDDHHNHSTTSTASNGKLDHECLQKLADQMHQARTDDNRHELWCMIAKKIGYKNDLQKIRERALISGVTPTSMVLKLWSEDPTKPDVATLIKALRHYKRTDLVDVVLCSSRIISV